MKYPSIAAPTLIPLVLAFGLSACADESISSLVERAQFDPESIDFGEIEVGEMSSQSVKLLNIGSATIVIESVEASPSFSLSSGSGALAGVRINPGSSIPIEALFLAGEEGAKTGVITIQFERTKAELQVTATGVITDLPMLALEPATLDFGTVEVGEESRLPITISNNGTAPGVVSAATLEQYGAASPFDLALPTGTTFPTTIQPGEAATYDVVFRPNVEGATGETILFSAEAPDLTLQLQGNGSPARGGIVCTPSTLDFGSVERGQMRTLQITCDARGGVARLISASFSPTEAVFALPSPPATSDLQDSEGVTFDVEFRAEGAPILHNSMLAVAFDGSDGLSQVDVPVRGEVVPPPVTETAMSFLLSWNSNFTDVDIHLVQPGGVLWDSSGMDCYYGQPAPDWGFLGDPTDDPFLDRDDTDGFGPENINLNVAAPGDYEVYIHYFADNFEGPTTATLEVFTAGVPAATVSRSLSCNETWHAGTVQWNGTSGTFVPANSVQLDDRGLCF